MMSVNNILEMNPGGNSLGKVEIAPEVIEIIAGIAASEVDGVASMRGNFASGVVERFGEKNSWQRRKGGTSRGRNPCGCLLCHEVWSFHPGGCSGHSG